MKLGVLAVAGWLVAAVLMVGVSWSAISVVRTAVVPQATVAGGLPAPLETSGTGAGGTPTASPSSAPTAAPTSSRPPVATPGGRAVLATGRGGSATVRCVGGQPRFVNLTPRQGYTARVDDSPGEVRFEGPSGARTEITASCAGDVARTSVEDRSGGGGGDDDDSGRGGDDDD